jgi:hypothetical protein
MRSNNNSPVSLIKSRLPLTLAACVALLSAATAAEAGWFGARGRGGPTVSSGPRISSGPSGFFSNRAVRIVNPVGKLGKLGNGGGNRISDGGGRHGGDGHPPRPRPHKPPIIVAVPPTIVTTVVPTVSVADPQIKKASSGGGGGGGNGGGNNPSSGSSSPRRAVSGVPAAGERRYVPDEVLIELSSTVTPEAIEAFARSMRLTRVESFSADGITTFRWRIPDPGRRSVPTVIRALEAQSIVIAAGPNFLYLLDDQRSIPPRSADAPSEGDAAQYALAKLRLPQAHAIAKGEKVLVAVIDSAVDVEHPELEGMIAESYDALEIGDRSATHGTAVTGAIVAHARLMGVAPKASILAIRAFGMQGKNNEGTSYSIKKAIVWAMSRGARVINMSFSGARDPSIEQKLAQAREQGIVLIAAAGNAGPKSEPLFPAA